MTLKKRWLRITHLLFIALLLIQLLPDKSTKPPGLQQPPQGRGGDALSQAGDHASRDKDILAHLSQSSLPR